MSTLTPEACALLARLLYSEWGGHWRHLPESIGYNHPDVVRAANAAARGMEEEARLRCESLSDIPELVYFLYGYMPGGDAWIKLRGEMTDDCPEHCSWDSRVKEDYFSGEDRDIEPSELARGFLLAWPLRRFAAVYEAVNGKPLPDYLRRAHKRLHDLYANRSP